MKRDDIMFDPLDVRARISPPFPLSPTPFDAWQHIGKTVFLDPRRVKFMPGQPREKFDDIEELGSGVKRQGQKTAILVFPINDPNFDVELIAGERRTRGCTAKGVMIRSEIRPVPASRREHFIDAFVENFNRRDLNLAETVKSVNRLVIEEGCTAVEVAEMAGRTVAWVDQYLRLGSLDLRVLPLLENNADEVRDGSGRKLRRKSLLPMSIALDVAKLPAKDQLPFAHMLLEEQVPIEAARGLVKRRLESTGDYASRKRAPSEQYGVLEREARRFETLVIRYHGLSKEELSAIAEVADRDKRKSLARCMHATARELDDLARSVDTGDLQSLGSPDSTQTKEYKYTPWTWHPRLQSHLLKMLLTEPNKR